MFLKNARLIGLVVIILAILIIAPAGAEFGTNWVGSFYNTEDLSGPIVDTGTYPNGINETWGTGSPVDDGAARVMTAVNPDGFSVRFVSTQTFVEGTYDFFLTFEGGLRLYIDGSLVVDQFGANPLTTVTYQQFISAGNHQLIVEYVDPAAPDTVGAIVQVQWFVAGTGNPGPTPTSVPVATAEVHTVRGLAVRTGPYLGASLITVARPGNSYPVSALNRSEGIFTWYLITVGDQTGWASGRYLTVRDEGVVIPEQITVFDQIDGAPDVGVTAVTRANMNLRVRPSVRTSRLLVIPWGAEMPLIGRTVQGGRDFWYQVRYEGVVGWIYAPYVTVRGPIDAVPIR